LRTAGVALKTPQRQERTLKIIVSNKSRTFKYDKHADTIELLTAERRSA